MSPAFLGFEAMYTYIDEKIYRWDAGHTGMRE
jgi:hypothetical protein